MKTLHRLHLATTTFCLAALLPARSVAEATTTKPVVAPSRALVTIMVTDPRPGPMTVRAADTETGPTSASAQWSDIKDQTYLLRARFFDGLKQLEAKLDDQINELSAQNAAVKSGPEAQKRDFAIKMMGNARSRLQSLEAELSKATPNNWVRTKEEVGQAWARTQKFYTLAKTITTS